MIRLGVVSPTRLYREGLVAILSSPPAFVVTSASGTAAGLEPEQIDVVVVDVSGPEMVAELRSLAAERPDARVVAVAVPDLKEHVLACAEAGITAYVTREASVEEVVASVESAARGEASCSPHMTATLLLHVGRLAARRREETVPELTSRQLEIVGLVELGLSNKEIAQRLHIEPSTVKNHLRAIFEKLDVHRRREAGPTARRHGLVVHLPRGLHPEN
jgi:two-component system, NarL family, nitrate/nitrite response regulator NarL